MARRGMGTTISINGTLIGGLNSIKPGERTAETTETTVLDSSSGYRDFIQTFKDGGEVDLKGFCDNNYTGQSALDAAYEAGTEDTYVITFPSALGYTYTFIGVITKLNNPGEANTSDPLAFEVTIKVKGKPVLGTTPSAGPTAFVFTQTDGITALTAENYMPAYAAGTRFYAFTFTTQTSFKVKVTAASHTIKLYVDDVYVEDLTSGTASSAIAIGADSCKKITVICYEAGKTALTYQVMVGRIS